MNLSLSKKSPVAATSSVSRASAQTTAAASAVAPETYTPENEITRYGNVAKVGASSGSSFTLTLTPGSTAKTYVIGDPHKAVNAALDKPAWSEPEAAPGSTPEAIKALAAEGFAISGVHYQVTSSSAQFGNPLKQVMGNHDGSYAAVPVNILATSRPDYQNDKLLIVEFKRPARLDSRNCFTLKVNAGESVTLNFFVAAYGN